MNNSNMYEARDANGHVFSAGDSVMVRCIVQSITPADPASLTQGSVADTINLVVIAPGNVVEKSNVTFSVECLTQLLMNLPQAKVTELSDWLPDQWKIRHEARMASLKAAPPAA